MSTTYWPTGKKSIGFVMAGEATKERSPIHHVWIADQSGSMWWAVAEVAKDMIAHMSEIEDGDYLSAGYFSGPGDWRWWITGSAVTGETRTRLAKIIRDNAHSRNTTCFSEILADLKTVVAITKPLSAVVSLAFLTDGHPVVPDYRKEREAIFRAIASVKDDLAEALLVGYGDYYNKTLLSEMAAAFGGVLQHADEIKEFGRFLGQVTVKKGRKRTTVTFPVGVDVAFAIEGGNLITFTVKDGKASVPTGARVFFETTTPTAAPPDPLEAQYAAVLLHLQQGDTDSALQGLSDIGDVALVQSAGSAVTNAEFGRAEKAVQEAMADPSKRFAKGQQKGCLPDPNAPDLLDAIALLTEDREAKFYPEHPQFKYRRVGRKAVTDGDYPKFEPDGAGVSFLDTVWHEERFNVSVSTLQKGHILLHGDFATIGLAERFPCIRFRTYSLAANGNPNVPVIPCSFSQDTHTQLMAMGAVDDPFFEPGKTFAVFLSRLPVLSRGKAKTPVSAERMAELAARSVLLAARIKALKTIRKELEPEKPKAAWTADQGALLLANGIKDGTYSPPSKLEEGTDTVLVREFQIKVKSYSSLPSLNAVRKKLESGKALTPSEEAVNAGIVEFETNCHAVGLPAKLGWIDWRLAVLTDEKRGIDREIQAARFPMGLLGRWFEGRSRAENEAIVKVEGRDFSVTFEVREVEIKI